MKIWYRKQDACGVILRIMGVIGVKLSLSKFHAILLHIFIFIKTDKSVSINKVPNYVVKFQKSRKSVIISLNKNKANNL